MKHKGIRPIYLPLEKDDDGRKRTTYYEYLPDGGYKIWNNKLLNSGCGKEITVITKCDELVWCPFCNEWASESQFDE